jgi:hypothetical protein
LVVSLYGASQESNSQTDWGSSELVMANIIKLEEAMKILHCNRQDIVWLLLVNRFNEFEIPPYKRSSSI